MKSRLTPACIHAERVLYFGMDNNGLAVSTNSETMTLKQLAEALDARSVGISYTSLSELVNAGDIAEQLGVTGGGNRRAFPREVADILTAFLPQFRQAKGKASQAPDMLRSFLTKPQSALVPISVPQISETANPVALAEAQGRAHGLAMQERVMTAQEAADYLHISVRLLRRTIKPYRRFGISSSGDRWRLSDLLSDAALP